MKSSIRYGKDLFGDPFVMMTTGLCRYSDAKSNPEGFWHDRRQDHKQARKLSSELFRIEIEAVEARTEKIMNHKGDKGHGKKSDIAG